MPTPAPYEEPILAHLKRLLGQIRTDSSYHTDAGKNVFLADERLAPTEDESGIVLIVHDAEEELLTQNGYTRDVNLRVDVEIFVPVGREVDGRKRVRTITRKVIADVRRAVLAGLRDDSIEPRPIQITLDGRTIAPLDNGSNWMIALQPVLWQVREEFQEM